MATVTLTPTSCMPQISLQNHKHHEILDTALLCSMYYIPYTLRQTFAQEQLHGLPKQFLIPPQNPPYLCKTLCKFCVRLETENPNFFNGFPERMRLTSSNAQTVFMNVAEETFTDGIKNWGRIVAVYALAGSMAIYFVKQKQLSVVKEIPNWITEFVDQNLLDWIMEQNGWDDLPDTLNMSKSGRSWGNLIAFGGVVAATAGVFLYSSGMR